VWKAGSRLALPVRRGAEAALWLVFLTVPLVISLAWGSIYDSDAYVAFGCARDIGGQGSIAASPARGQALYEAPMYVLALGLLAKMGVSVPLAGMVLSALGWGVAAIAIYGAGRAVHRRVAAIASASLLVFSPLIVSTLGTGVSWTVALAWIAVASSAKKAWRAQACALTLMLGTHLESSTISLIALLFVFQWIERRGFPLRPGLTLTLAALGWALVAVALEDVAAVSLVVHREMNLGSWKRGIQQLLDESELYWLFLPLCLYGGWAELEVLRTAPRRGALQAGVLAGGWLVTAVLSGSVVARAMVSALTTFLIGLGIDALSLAAERIQAHSTVRFGRSALALMLAVIAGLPLGMAQASSLLYRYRMRPLERQSLEQQAGDWLRAHSEPTATVYGSGRVGYLANRRTLLWDGQGSDRAAVAEQLRVLNANWPAYCVSFRSIGWDRLTRAGWFRDYYVPLRAFESPYDSTSPLVIWGYRFRGLDWGERQPLNVQLAGGVNWVGYSYAPDRIQPGDSVRMTVFLQATQPFTESYHVIAEVISPDDGANWARQMITPSSTLLGWWQEGSVIAERIVMTTTPDTPVGVYHLNVHVLAPDLKTFLSFYRGDDTSPLRRITLGRVAVPWQGTLDVERVEPVDARFSDQIRLLGFEAADRLSPGTAFSVTLYWEALRPPDDDYIVFVHLLDGAGQAVVSHDGPPMNRRYPTGAWLSGETVPDVHRLALSPDLPVGTYRLEVGMYRWPSIERLPIWDRHGIEQVERTILLQEIEIR
jgi:hypothetical protein